MSAHNLPLFLGCVHLLSCGLFRWLVGNVVKRFVLGGRPYDSVRNALTVMSQPPRAHSLQRRKLSTAAREKTRLVDDVAVMRAEAGGIVPSVHNWSCVARTFEHNGAVMYLLS